MTKQLPLRILILFAPLVLLGALHKLSGEPTILLAQGSLQTPPNFKVAFIGDQGLGQDSEAVLSLIQTEGAAMVLHQGDFDYEDDPEAWDQQINDILGPTFPYFASVGNHDVSQWLAYQQKLQNRLDTIPDVTCVGDLGVKSACHYQGLFFILSGAGTLDFGHDTYIRDQLAANSSIWRVCSWHKNQTAMQVGSKGDSVGWGPYEECRKGGAIIATGHEHSYSRTRTLTNTETQSVDPSCVDDPDTPDPDVCVSRGATFVFVSGLAGKSIRNQDRCLPTTFPYGCAGEWAKIYTSDQEAQHGALFITFHVDGDPGKASAYFKNIDGLIVDSFTITSTDPLPLVPHLSLSKSVSPSLADLDETITYTIHLSNTGTAAAANVVMTDTLPAEVSFGGWVEQGSAQFPVTDTITLPDGGITTVPPNTIGWGPHDIPAQTGHTLIFTVSVNNGTNLLGRTITNTAWYTSSNAGSDRATINVFLGPFRTFLPLLIK